MINVALRRILSATGYIADGEAAPGVLLGDEARLGRRGRSFAPDALWRGQSSLKVYFKFTSSPPADGCLAAWRQEIWNEGFAPLLWIVSPDRIDLYNGFGRPRLEADPTENRLASFLTIASGLEELDALAGRLAMETGQFWTKTKQVDRRTAVDQLLLSDLAALERDLVSANLVRDEAQALIGRAIFTQYLLDRDIITAERLHSICGTTRLSAALRNRQATSQIFNWLSKTFNGDMFPPSSAAPPAPAHLSRVADFLDAVDPVSRQTTFFPYQFDVIPVELISSIYEQFAHSGATPVAGRTRSTEATRAGVYYTRLPVVSLILDEIMDGLDGEQTVLDLTCGSGVFLVEAFRRLIHLKGLRVPLTRAVIRKALYTQVYGVDISEAAIRVAAFSLYLAALELDPDPQPPEGLTFEPLVGRTLFVGNARTIEQTEAGSKHLLDTNGPKSFDVIVGNPPWSFNGKTGTADRRKGGKALPAQPRGVGLDFLMRATEFANTHTRIGMVLSATPFFSASKTGAAAARHAIKALSPVTLVNLSNLRSWLFEGAAMPAVILFSGHRPQPTDTLTIVQVPWSPAGPRSHTFEIAPSDISRISLADWEAQPTRLKTAAFGRRRDLRLVDDLIDAHGSLSDRLQDIGTLLGDGLIVGRIENRNRDALSLTALEYLQKNDLHPFSVPDSLPSFGLKAAQRPRDRALYKAPLLLVKEFLPGGPRPLTAVADRDLVFSEAFFGAPFPPAYRRAAHILAGVLGSALAAWFFLMTAGEFGLYKRRLFRQDVALLPTPDLALVMSSEAGQKIYALEQQFRSRAPTEAELFVLDEAVFDLYGLDADDRIVMRDGLVRAGWQWSAGLSDSITSADPHEAVAAYARTFSAVVDRWLAARRQRSIRAEVFDLRGTDAMRIVRFVLDDGAKAPKVEIVSPGGNLAAVFGQLEGRMKVPLASALTGQRELRVHGRNEVVIVKPAARRHWLESVALEDADAVIAESFAGRRH